VATDAELIQIIRQLLAGQLPATGALMHTPANMLYGWPSPPEEPPATAVTSTPVNLNTLPDKPPVPPLLPILEEVQVENAQVLPEIDQTLEQINATMGGIDTASASLEPAPLQIPKVQEAMTEAGGAVTTTLDAL
jgi:hypothetical protein